MNKKTDFSYEGNVGQWWLAHSLDSAHKRAYRNIADFIRASFTRDPGLIVDYACGAGNLLSLLSERFRRSRLVGLDGSSLFLGLAMRRFTLLPRQCSKRISLIHTPLPNLRILRGKADVAIFCFPNMVPYPGKTADWESGKYLNRKDRQIAESLSRAGDPDACTGVTHDTSANQYALEQGRCISLNLRRLLVKGGLCIRIEYATMQRHELSKLELEYVSFEEGSLETRIDGKMPSQWFRLVASAYFRSRVLEDVYEQTGDERDKNGGYLITVLRAV